MWYFEGGSVRVPFSLSVCGSEPAFVLRTLESAWPLGWVWVCEVPAVVPFIEKIKP